MVTSCGMDPVPVKGIQMGHSLGSARIRCCSGSIGLGHCHLTRQAYMAIGKALTFFGGTVVFHTHIYHIYIWLLDFWWEARNLHQLRMSTHGVWSGNLTTSWCLPEAEWPYEFLRFSRVDESSRRICLYFSIRTDVKRWFSRVSSNHRTWKVLEVISLVQRCSKLMWTWGDKAHVMKWLMGRRERVTNQSAGMVLFPPLAHHSQARKCPVRWSLIPFSSDLFCQTLEKRMNMVRKMI